MPKQVDHGQRRTLIADALMRVAAERGLEAVSLRHVAEEAGVSAGMVQHYFRTRDEMMEFAMKVVRERVGRRMDAAGAALGPAPTIRAALRAMLVELLPVDEPRRADGRVALAFLAYAAVRPAAAASMRADTAGMLAFITEQLHTAQHAGEVRPGVPPAAAAVGLVAVVEGLGLYLLGDNYPPQQALDALDAHLDLIFEVGAR
ncbi:TetR/AcrR family transcriptional regulator [Solwaraspora sp. WMMD1047]|uniref:TetR/AcrR family transcriptional regulator n=1 Tax=Solwaraspora sp. WMMD1047 TaxID=3016102 RepID=UPI002417D2F9|nr:TetR/AcrR family transcriptional regulator [Solwaraspora sp. WMMD1047]MDG4827974.1 TetR/AcrR family transcriptional regulator [Solwaraspora sp. WMMD1047]